MAAMLWIGQFPSYFGLLYNFLRRLSSRTGNVDWYEVFFWETGIDSDKVQRWKAWR